MPSAKILIFILILLSASKLSASQSQEFKELSNRLLEGQDSMEFSMPLREYSRTGMVLNDVIHDDQFDGERKIESWFNNRVFSDQVVKNKSALLLGFSWVSGVLGSIVFFDLGQELGDKYNPGLGYALGAVSTIPIAILGSRFVEEIFSQASGYVCAKQPLTDTAIEEKGCQKPDIAMVPVRLFQILIGTISAAPFTYLSYKKWYSAIGVASIPLFEVPTFYVKAIADIWALNALGHMYFDEIRSKIDRDFVGHSSVRYRRQILIDRINETKSLVSKLPSGTVDLVIKRWSSRQGESEVSTSVLIHEILNFQNYLSEIHQIVSEPDRESMLRKIFRFTGAAIGLLSMAAVEPLAKDSMTKTFGALEFENDSLATAGAWGATAAAASLMGYATADSFGKFYDFGAHGVKKLADLYRRKCGGYTPAPQHESDNNESPPPVGFVKKLGRAICSRVGVGGISAVFSAFSSLPNIQLSVDFLGTKSAFDKIAVFCSTVSPFSMNFWAIDDFLMTRKGLSDSRGILFKKLGAIEEGLGKFDDSTINALFAKIVRADA